MLIGAIGSRISALLVGANAQAGFTLSLVCDDAGLLLAVAGNGADEEQLAGLTSLFDDIVVRARRDLGIPDVDEVTMVDRRWGRCVIRPLATDGSRRHFLVVMLAANRTWRRATNTLKKEVQGLFREASLP